MSTYDTCGYIQGVITIIAYRVDEVVPTHVRAFLITPTCDITQVSQEIQLKCEQDHTEDIKCRHYSRPIIICSKQRKKLACIESSRRSGRKFGSVRKRSVCVCK